MHISPQCIYTVYINISHSINALRGGVNLYVIKCLMTKFYAECEFQSAKAVAFKIILRKEVQTYSKE